MVSLGGRDNRGSHVTLPRVWEARLAMVVAALKIVVEHMGQEGPCHLAPMDQGQTLTVQEPRCLQVAGVSQG